MKRAIATLLALASLAMHQFALAAGEGAGFIDQVFASRDTVRLVGWAADGGETIQPGRIAIYIGETKMFDGEFERTNRPDVVQAYGKPGWLQAGISVDLGLPPETKGGRHSVRAEISFAGGQRLALRHTPGAETVLVPYRNESANGILVAALLFAAMAVLVLFLKAAAVTRLMRSRFDLAVCDWHLTCAATVALFGVLVGFGITGSSIALLAAGTPLTTTDEIPLAGTDRPIRSDEWLVFTPFAVSQVNHVPAFPIVNRNIGVAGQNMLVLGMEGVPVWHLSALARPATWGFLLLDLKRGLAWYWWFPLFACFGAVWALLATLSGGHWRVSALLALGFVVSPSVAGWSNWPAYAVMFPAAAAALFVALLRNASRRVQCSYAVGLGICLAGGALILYPAWQVPLTYLVAMVLLTHLVAERLHTQILVRWPQLLLAAAIALIILGSWWIDARDAIAAMLATVYPGQRTSVAGGWSQPWVWAKGLANLQTMFFDLKGVSNSSEASSFLYVFPPIIVVLIVSALRIRRVPIEFFGVLAFLVVAVSYQFIGFPKILADLSLWGRTTPDRVDLSVGLAQTIVFSLWFKHASRFADPQRRATSCLFLFPALVWGGLLFHWLTVAPVEMSQLYSNASALFMASLAALISWSLATRHYGTGLPILTVFGASISFAFNPIRVAPSEFRSIDIRSMCGVPKDAPMPRVLALGGQIPVASETPAMALLASGSPAVNGIHYYPQFAMWKNVDPAAGLAAIYNRYQHLIVSAQTDDRLLTIESPRADVVKVQIDVSAFDFRKFGATCVAGPAEQIKGAASNARLVHRGDYNAWSFYSVN